MPAPRRSLRVALVGAAALFVGCGEEAQEPSARPNVVLISLDSTRRDLFGAYGHVPKHATSEEVSPNLDRLAREGVVFEDAYASTSWTLPSHVSLMSGVPELVHGVDIDYLRPDPAQANLASVLQSNGYRTAGFFSGPYLDPRFGFARGFDRYEGAFGPQLVNASEELHAAERKIAAAQAGGDRDAFRRAWGEQIAADSLVNQLSSRDSSSKRVIELALEEVARAQREDRPLFLFLHFFDPHYDYIPPAPHDSRFDPDYAGEIDGEGFYENPGVSVPDAKSPMSRRQTASARDMDHIQALYEGELSWTDAQIGRLIAALDAAGMREDTLFVITADHGEEFFEHGSIGHRQTLFEEVLRVPLILSQAGRLAPARVRGPVSNVDVFATVLELSGVEAPTRTISASLVPLMDGEEAPGARGVFGRLVTQRDIELPVQTPDGNFQLPCKLIRVQESYRRGPIKISREVRWPEPTTAEAKPHLAQRRLDAIAGERLVWIDIEAHPEERAEQHSALFDDPRALDALRAFRAEYAALLNRRREVREKDANEPSLPGLDSLGYTGSDSGAGSGMDDLFVLPPPGAAVFAEKR